MYFFKRCIKIIKIEIKCVLTEINFLIFNFQESEGQKTNNGIQYRLQLLYANGKLSLILKLIFRLSNIKGGDEYKKKTTIFFS